METGPVSLSRRPSGYTQGTDGSTPPHVGGPGAGAHTGHDLPYAGSAKAGSAKADTQAIERSGGFMPIASKETLLVCGLGNPGDAYEHTRHNAGFAVVDALAERGCVSYWKSEAGCLVASWGRRGPDGRTRTVLLAKPQAYMNVSGGPLSKLMRQRGISAQEILVVHDEVDLPSGVVRVKSGGGLNAHNGLRSIADKLGTRDFARVRCGIGRPPGRMSVADFALRQLKGSFLADFELGAQRAADACELCLDQGVARAVEQLG